ncbi:MAG: TetM/TetW/TetO/TetS family tetracycline resistance ribosomal protection protein [Eubacteriales bacterium]|nr:TetM/TetW/TetO/TetS family tetracycline resistance ribosomal protection protein [Eubacteriales bacterium]
MNEDLHTNKTEAAAGGIGRRLVIGILAHVDAGKTTLSESFLYNSGKIRKLGRVDHKDAYLDTDQMERDRGITIFAKQAEMEWENLSVTLLDTPGHTDFSPEMERTLQVLDLAVLVISAADGVTGQVRTIWKLLSHYKVPAFIFVNKMDQSGADAETVFEQLQSGLKANVVDFSGKVSGSLDSDEQQENLAVCDEALMERYLEGNPVETEDIRRLIGRSRLYPVYFGSALRNDGVEELMKGIEEYAPVPSYGDEFAAKIFKISRDDTGSRLTWMKIVGGSLKVRSALSDDEKVNQIRIYSGKGFEPIQEAEAGRICAVTGLSNTYVGQNLGQYLGEEQAILQPVYTSTILLDPEQDQVEALAKLRILEEEEPMLHIRVDENDGTISAQIMGQVQTEILRNILQERFDLPVKFGPPAIVYKETIASPVEGVGHYEPLRHYSEVHLLLEPGEPGSGMVFDTACSTDHLAKNWQRLILTHLEEKTYRGVLTNAELTDMRIRVIGGRAHPKHTEGGDFRQSTYRAVRQGLMMARNVLLEPIYDFRAELPQENIGRFLSDIQRMEGTTDLPDGDGVQAVITGTVPAASLGDYAREMTAYTRGKGQLFCTLKGYEPCRHPEEVILEKGYDAEADMNDPSSSVFCSHGAGIVVPWNLVRDYMHVDTGWRPEYDPTEELSETDDEEMLKTYGADWQKKKREKKLSFAEQQKQRFAAEDELQQIFERTYSGASWHTPLRNDANYTSNDRGFWSKDGSLEREEAEKTEKEAAARAARKMSGKPVVTVSAPEKNKPAENYFLVDGYNIIFQWEELRNLAARNIDSARDKLMDILSNYHGTRSGTMILVFDAYKVHGGTGEVYKYNNIYVVYTKEAETADAYIEKTVHKLGKNKNITVATSDGLEQMIIFGDGARRMSGRELKLEIEASMKDLRDNWLS